MCGRGGDVREFEIGVWLGSHDGNLLGLYLGIYVEREMEGIWEFFELDPS